METEDISPLNQCTALEQLLIGGLLKITNLKPLSSLTMLKFLNISCVPAKNLNPLSAMDVNLFRERKPQVFHYILLQQFQSFLKPSFLPFSHLP